MKLWRIFLSVPPIALLFCVAPFAAADQLVEPPVTLEANHGFCQNGAFVPLVPVAGDPPKLISWGTHCGVEQEKPAAAHTSSSSLLNTSASTWPATLILRPSH